MRRSGPRYTWIGVAHVHLGATVWRKVAKNCSSMRIAIWKEDRRRCLGLYIYVDTEQFKTSSILLGQYIFGTYLPIQHEMLHIRSKVE